MQTDWHRNSWQSNPVSTDLVSFGSQPHHPMDTELWGRAYCSTHVIIVWALLVSTVCQMWPEVAVLLPNQPHLWNSVIYVQVLGENCGEHMIWPQRSWLDCRFPCKYSRGFIVKYNAKNHWKTTRVDTFLWPFVNKSCWLGDSSNSVVNCPASHI